VAIVLVLAIAILARLWVDDPTEAVQGSEATSVSVVNGTTGRPALPESSSWPTVAPVPGNIQPSTEDWEALLPRLQAVVDAAPDDINAQRKLALAYHNLGRLEEAAAIYERILAIAEDAVLRDRLGNVLRDQGDLGGAEAAYRRAIADDPTLAPPYLNLAELLWRQGRDEQALAVIDEGLAAVPEENHASLEEGRRVLEGVAR
jgi:tetratricopeptide (TPR) repeat protein